MSPSFLTAPGQEDAVIALHDEWKRERLPRAKGYVSGELFRDIRDSRSFITIARFESAEAARTTADALSKMPGIAGWST